MASKVAKRQVRIFTLVLTTSLICSLLVTAGFSMEQEDERKRGPRSFPNKTLPSDMIRPVVHQGAAHEKGGFKEGDIAGICPQERNTPRAPDPIYKMTNPLDPTPENLRAGETLFKIDARPTACKVCHGFGGDGLGVIFEQLTPKPRNFTCYYIMDDIPDGQIYWIIKNGSPGTKMPSFGALSDKEVWQLVLYIRQFSRKIK